MANFADRIGGGEESLLGLVRGLDRRRFAPHVHVPGEGGMAIELRRIGVPIALRPLPTVRPWTVLAGGRAVRDLRALLSARRIRLVHAHGSRGALYAGLAARRSRVPVIWHVRIVDRDPWLDGLLLRMSSAVVANSAAAAGRFRGRSGAATKVQVVPNGVDLERFGPGAAAGLTKTLAPPAGGAVVVYIGRLERGKGPDLFLEAARIDQEKPRLRQRPLDDTGGLEKEVGTFAALETSDVDDDRAPRRRRERLREPRGSPGAEPLEVYAVRNDLDLRRSARAPAKSPGGGGRVRDDRARHPQQETVEPRVPIDDPDMPDDGDPGSPGREPGVQRPTTPVGVDESNPPCGEERAEVADGAAAREDGPGPHRGERPEGDRDADAAQLDRHAALPGHVDVRSEPPSVEPAHQPEQALLTATDPIREVRHEEDGHRLAHPARSPARSATGHRLIQLQRRLGARGPRPAGHREVSRRGGHAGRAGGVVEDPAEGRGERRRVTGSHEPRAHAVR